MIASRRVRAAGVVLVLGAGSMVGVSSATPVTAAPVDPEILKAAAPASCTGTEDTKWTGATSSAWSVAGNWTAGVPGGGQSVCIASAANQPTITTSANVGLITGEIGTTITIDAGTLTATDSYSRIQDLVIKNDGALSNPNGFSVAGNFQFSSGTLQGPAGFGVAGTLTLDTIDIKTIGVDLYTGGPVQWQGGNVNSTSAVGIHNYGGWDLNAPTNSTLTLAGTFDNRAEFLLDNPHQINFNGSFANFDNLGKLNLQNQSIFNIVGTHNFENRGEVNLSKASKLNIGTNPYKQITFGGTTNIDPTSTIITNDVQLNIGSLNNKGTIQGNITFNNGDLTSTGNVIGNININGGKARLSNKITGNINVTNGELFISPEGGPGVLDLNGDYVQSGGLTQLDLVGKKNLPGTDFDQINSKKITISSSAKLQINTPTYNPNTGPLPKFFSATETVTGQFSEVLTGAKHTQINFTLGAGGSTSDAIVTSSIGHPQDPASIGTGYNMIDAKGGIYSFGTAKSYGSLSNLTLNAPVVGLSNTSTGAGYYAVGSDGGVFAFGDAKFSGSMGGKQLNQPMVAIAANPVKEGYWTVAADGGVFSYGQSQFYGSTAALKLNAPVVDIIPTPTGEGYHLIGADGGVFAFGDAKYAGSTGNIKLNQPIVSAATAASGDGYWLTAADGGVFSFGNVKFHGSTGNLKLNSPIVSIRALSDQTGYTLLAADGGVFNFGDAPFFGTPGTVLQETVVS